MEPIFYVNGEYAPESKALLGATDIGLLRGYGVFDFTITYDRKPFRLRDHLDRLWNSARIIGLILPWSKEELEDLVYKTLDMNPEGEKGIRIVVTGGQSNDTFLPSGKPSLIIIVKPVKEYPKKYYTEGVKVITYQGKREIPEAKTLNYITPVRALGLARAMGAEEAIYTSEGLLYECMACSLFTVLNGVILTAGNEVLDGITRRTILEVIEGEIPVKYRFVRVSEIPNLNEAFLTSSSHGVMPIMQIDETVIGEGKRGPITERVMKLFQDYTGKRLY